MLYTILGGADAIELVDTIDAPKMVNFPNGDMVEEFSVSSPPTIISPTSKVPRSGSFGSVNRRYRHTSQHHVPVGVDAFSDVGVPLIERAMSPRTASSLMGGTGVPLPISNVSGSAIMNNEQYPCDCCRIEDQQYVRDFTPSGSMLRRPEVSFLYHFLPLQ